ncbi:pilus assembly protein TadG-related protein [Aestuariivirga litoralis]|nr:pilus assembly protein TadG-related protein [Aestuariivirga litoralis]
MKTFVHRQRERGAVAIIVAVALVGLMVLAAAAIDLGRAYLIRSDLQIAVDSAAKAAAADALEQPLGITEAEKKARAKATVIAFFKANYNISPELLVFNPNDVNDLQVDYVSTGENEDSIIITAKGKVQLAFARLLVPEIPITVGGRVKRPRPAPLELALVLDVTGSMVELMDSGKSKMVEMQKAATGLTDYVLDSDYAKVGIVPFARAVNITTAYNGAPWLKLGTPDRLCDLHCSPLVCKAGYWTECANSDGPGTYRCYRCTEYEPRVCTGCRTVEFAGCVPMRGSGTPWTPIPNISSPTSPPYEGPIGGCDTPWITDLTAKADVNNTGKTIIRNRINALPVMGNGNTNQTYIPVGLIWGWNMLTPEEPLTKSSSATGDSAPRKSIVLLTDGQNWWRPTTAKDGVRGPSAASDQLTLDICANIKDDDIKISTVALSINITDTLDMLKNCASSPADFYNVNTAAGLQNAFKRIGMAFSYNSLKE